MKVFKISPGKDLNWCIEKNPENIISWIAESEVGNTITIEVIEMTEKEYENLPEYEGP